MSLRDQIEEALNARAAEPKGTASTVAGDFEGVTAEIAVRDSDRLGVVVESIDVKGSPGKLDGRSERIAQCLRPVGERLVPVELDSTLGGASLRTCPEDMHGGRFFQVDIGLDRAKISRHRVSEGGVREPQDFGLTRDQLGDLLDQLEGVLKG